MFTVSEHPALTQVQAWARDNRWLEATTRWQMYHMMHTDAAYFRPIPVIVGGWTPDNPPEYEVGDEYPLEIVY